jgi:hypothetical protein
MVTYKIKGISDDQTECDCCGRKGLKRTVALEVFEQGESTLEVIRVGVDCASVLISRTGKPKSARVIKKEAEALKTHEERCKELLEQGYQWKLANRISQDKGQANLAYLRQWKAADYRDTDRGVLLSNGVSFARIPSDSTPVQPGSPEGRFIRELQDRGFEPLQEV